MQLIHFFPTVFENKKIYDLKFEHEVSSEGKVSAKRVMGRLRARSLLFRKLHVSHFKYLRRLCVGKRAEF